MIDNQIAHGEQALAPERKKLRPVKSDVLQFATLLAIALSMTDICRIDRKYTKVAISNRAVTLGTWTK